MHILLIHQSFAALDEPGGTRHHEMARHLSQRGHTVTVIASSVSYLTGDGRKETVTQAGFQKAPSPTEDSGQNTITIHRVPTYSGLHRSFAHRVIAFLSFMASSFLAGLRVQEVDLVWGTSPPIFQGLTAWALARLKRVPFLFEVRDLWPAFAIAVGVLRQPALIRASEWLERFLYRQADVVVANSPGFSEHIRSRGARRVQLVPNGAETAMFNPAADGADFRCAHYLQEKFVVLYAGAHGISNDLDTLLAAAELLSDRLEIAIILLGDGKEKNALMASAAARELSNVLFLPPIPKIRMPEALAAADACVAILKPIPLYATVYPNKVFDYMAAGRPVILAIPGVIRQVVETAGAGLAVNPGDPSALAQAICNLADDRQAGRSMGIRGRRYVEEHFDRPLIAAKMAGIIENLGRNSSWR
jgi:glycosyltransferase involved in cell wall biosynthesis